MTHPTDDNEPPMPERPPYRPPVGMPLRKEGRWGAPFSILVHVVLILLLVAPIFATVIAPEMFPGGGTGPAGGGGGGRGGFGWWRREPIVPEVLRYIRVAPEAAPSPEKAPAPDPTFQVPEQPVAPPVIDAQPAVKQQVPEAVAPVPGAGGGTGDDGTSGTGPGRGGGIGSGVGTGQGSGTGEGTGGGEGRDYLPTPDFLPLPPEPRPGSVRGRSIAVTFSINARGEITRLDFATTGDRNYDRRFRDRLREARFRPAVGPDGQPVPATFPMVFQL